MNQTEIASIISEWSGKYGHHYHPPASAERVAELEFVIGNQLPQDYRDFLLHIADGGSNGYDSLVSSSEQIERYLDDRANARVRRVFPFTTTHAELFASGDEDKIVLPVAVWDGKQFGSDGLDGTVVIQQK